MTLRAMPVQALDDIERVRLMRNICRAGFSHHTDEISEGAHWAWWEQTQPLAWLYMQTDGLCVGFGLLRKDDEDHWVTVVAVLPEFGGQGYGKVITHDIVTRAPDQCWATARRDNPAAVKLHAAADWQVIEGPDPALVYFRTWPPPVEPPEPEPRDFRFALQPSLRPAFAAESGPDCRVEWRDQPNGCVVRVVSWVMSESACTVGTELAAPQPSPWLDPATGRELSR